MNRPDHLFLSVLISERAIVFDAVAGIGSAKLSNGQYGQVHFVLAVASVVVHVIALKIDQIVFVYSLKEKVFDIGGNSRA